MSRRHSLATRLALAIGGAVGTVILAAGSLVAVGVIVRFDAFLEAARMERYTQVAEVAAGLAAERGSLDLQKQDLRELAVAAGGPIEIRDGSGAVVARLDALPGVGVGAPGGRSATEPPVEVPLVVDGATVGTLVVYPMLTSGARPGATPSAFRDTTALILAVAGCGAILASMVVAWLLARRLTRPLRHLAVASRTIGSGDLSARVVPPPDAEGHDLGVAFNGMAESLERSESLRRRAANDLAHELATPVTVLAGRLQALADGVIAPTAPELAATRDAADEVRRLVTDLQDLAAAEGAVLQRTPESVDLVEIARSAAATARTLFIGAEVELIAPPADAAPVPVRLDQRQIGRCLANLLTNAAAYTPSGGRAEIEVTATQGTACLRVRDTGPGIPPEHLPHVFERYYRADPLRRRTPGMPGGTGVGLTVAREFAHANGCRLVVESSGPTGTTFLLEVPRTAQPD